MFKEEYEVVKFKHIVPTKLDDEKYRQLKEKGEVFGGELVVCDGEKKQFNLCLDVLGS